jgi:transcriptional regulator GlxA family with amidase domain
MRDSRESQFTDERDWYGRGVEAYLDAIYRAAGSRATASEFAEQFGTDPATLSRTFRRLFGKTPLEYFRYQQLIYAAKLLRRSPMTVEEITVTAGLGTRSTFFRLFAEQFGTSPDQYRRNPFVLPPAGEPC